MDLPITVLPILIGLLRQDRADGELALEQNDGVRRLSFKGGELIHLESEVAGEKFGSRLLRQGVLDLPALNGILANKAPGPFGEKVIQSGLMSFQERDAQFLALQAQIMVHALEHPVLHATWIQAQPGRKAVEEPSFKLPYRQFVWDTFREANYLSDLLVALEAGTGWLWEGPANLLDELGDLPLTPNTAYALSFLGTDPIGFETFWSLGNLQVEEAGRLITILWALGALSLTGDNLPNLTAGAPEAARPPSPAPEVPPIGPAIELDYSSMEMEMEVLDDEPECEPEQAASPKPHAEEYPPISAEDDNLMGTPSAAVTPTPRGAPTQGSSQRLDPFSRPGFSPPPAPPPPAVPPPPRTSLPRQDPFSRPDPSRNLVPPPPADNRETPAIPAIELDHGAPSPPIPPPALFAEMPPPMPPPPFLKGPARARMLFSQAKQQMLMDRNVEAIRTLELAVQLGIEANLAYEAWLMLGQLRLANPAWSTRAIDALQHACDLQPKEAEPWVIMGELYHRKGFEANAASCYRKALALDRSVRIPPDVDMEATDPPEPPAPANTKHPVLGKVRKLFGGS